MGLLRPCTGGQPSREFPVALGEISSWLLRQVATNYCALMRHLHESLQIQLQVISGRLNRLALSCKRKAYCNFFQLRRVFLRAL